MNPPIASERGPKEKRESLAGYLVVPLLFLASYVGARAGIESTEPGSNAALAFALLPVPFFAFLIYAYVRAVRGMDELGRRIQLEGLAFAFPIALLVLFTAGLLHLAGFRGEQNWDLPRIWPFLLLPYFGGVALAHKRYS